jgi:acyl-CoA reductase-like NAD-dependent aldehyde dehydrogenase
VAATETDVQTLQNFIDGESAAPADGRTEPVVNPATGETIAHAPLSSRGDVDRDVAVARSAF